MAAKWYNSLDTNSNLLTNFKNNLHTFEGFERGGLQQIHWTFFWLLLFWFWTQFVCLFLKIVSSNFFTLFLSGFFSCESSFRSKVSSWEFSWILLSKLINFYKSKITYFVNEKIRLLTDSTEPSVWFFVYFLLSWSEARRPVDSQ